MIVYTDTFTHIYIHACMPGAPLSADHSAHFPLLAIIMIIVTVIYHYKEPLDTKHFRPSNSFNRADIILGLDVYPISSPGMNSGKKYLKYSHSCS